MMMKEHWQIHKTPVKSSSGVVVSQHHMASTVGARILAAGGNAMDAAIATSFAIGVVEPWMSGLGGGGLLLAARPEQKQSNALFFNMKSSASTDIANYPRVDGVSHDLFSWPAVLDDRNVHGPYSIAVPGHVAGMEAAHRQWASMSWQELLEPAIELCRDGISVDWMTTLRIAAAATGLKRYSGHEIYLPDGEVPAGQWGGPSPKIVNHHLVDTLEQLAQAGPRDFYEGDISHSLISDAKELGIPVTSADLSDYKPHWMEPIKVDYRNHEISLVPGLTGGPSLAAVFAEMNDHNAPASRQPDGVYFSQITNALESAFRERISGSGESESAPGCTTHINVVDKTGYTVCLTQTLLSVFGSKVTMPGTGVLMNNGMMWFDPEPGKANSIGANKYPLCNMCPALIKQQDGSLLAVGSSGGRRIVGAVAQLSLWLTDFNMNLQSAMEQPRVDVSGTETVYVDSRLDADSLAYLQQNYNVECAQSMVYPNLFGCPNVASWSNDSGAQGMPFIYSPLAAAVSADEV